MRKGILSPLRNNREIVRKAVPVKGLRWLLVISTLILVFVCIDIVSADYTYIVKPGDTLFRIAVNHGLTLGELAEANGIVNPSVIYSGQTLIIPDKGSSADGESETPIYHLVQRGDTLLKIAVRYGLSMHTVAQANSITNYDLVFAGQTLKIPTTNAAPISDSQTTASLPDSSADEAVQGERWIDVNLSTQLLTAYEGCQAVMSTYISSGAWPHVTVTGSFEVYLRYPSQDMDGYRLGYDYYLEDVPYVMYFYKDYALHGTYWHNNFGWPMSHGCVNMRTSDAQWLYNWSSYGTTVNIHY